MIRKFFILILLSLLFTGCTQKDNLGFVPESLKLKTTKDKILFSRDIDWIIEKEKGVLENKGKIKEYLYISDVEVLPTQDEDISKRTKNAQFFKKGVKGGQEEWEGKFYSGEPFYKDTKNNKWYQTETATTTIEAFKEQTKVVWYEKLLGKEVLADTFYSGQGDGFVGRRNQATWNDAHNATDGSWARTTDSSYVIAETQGLLGGEGVAIYRGFLPFDTSALNEGITITSATLSLYVTFKVADEDDGNDYLNVVQTSQASSTILAIGDYDTCGATHSPIVGATAIDISSAITLNAYNTWTLNATGLTWISTTGYTLLGMREGHDLVDDPMSDYGVNNTNIQFSEYTGTTQDPYLTVVYTTGGASGCFHTGGDWYINSACWISNNTTTNGTIYIGNGGSLNCIDGAVIQAQGIQGTRGSTINAESSCKMQFWDFK